MYCFLICILTILLNICATTLTQITSQSAINQQGVTLASQGNVVKGSKDVETIIPVPARCMPEKQVVKIGPPTDSTQFYTPGCTRIERCGGCCTQDNLLSCQPEETTIVNLQVTSINIQRNGINKNERPLIQKVIVPMEKHIKCKCDCKIKKENCNVLQEYVKKDCICVCTNKDERAKCKDDANNKHWDPHTCICNCKETKDCQTGYIFNKHTCSCEAQRTRTRYSSYSGTSLLYRKQILDE